MTTRRSEILIRAPLERVREILLRPARAARVERCVHRPGRPRDHGPRATSTT